MMGIFQFLLTHRVEFYHSWLHTIDVFTLLEPLYCSFTILPYDLGKYDVTSVRLIQGLMYLAHLVLNVA